MVRISVSMATQRKIWRLHFLPTMYRKGKNHFRKLSSASVLTPNFEYDVRFQKIFPTNNRIAK